MNDTRLLFDTGARCTDGACGRLQRAIIDPGQEARLTYLAVGPDGLPGGHLVPASLVSSADAEVLLRCTLAEFARLESDKETSWQHTASWPYSSDAPGGRFPAGVEGIERDTGYGNRTFIRDRIPEGGVELRRGTLVYGVDREVGRIQGLIIELPGALLTHLLVSRGRLFGRRSFSVPIGVVTGFGDGVQLDWTAEQVRTLAAPW